MRWKDITHFEYNKYKGSINGKPMMNLETLNLKRVMVVEDVVDSKLTM